MPDEITAVAIGTGAERFDAATIFLAALAYPESHKKRDHACLAMRAMMFREANKIAWGPRIPASNEAFAIRRDMMKAAMKQLEDRLTKRLKAAHVFSKLVLKTKPAMGAPPYSLNQMQAALNIGPRNYESWRLEVMHLAMGLRSMELKWSDPRAFGVLPLLANPDWVAAAIASAENWAQY